jgi:hypothetical protein
MIGQSTPDGYAYFVLNAYQPTGDTDVWNRMEVAQPVGGVFIDASGFTIRRGNTLNTGTRLALFDTILMGVNYTNTTVYTTLSAVMPHLAPIMGHRLVCSIRWVTAGEPPGRT